MTAHPTARRSRLWSIALAVTLTVASALILGQAAAANPTTGPDGHAKPTIVLVHGAWADGSSWSGVVQRLQREGYTVDVPPNPLRGLAADSAYLADFLTTVPGPIILVGHSYGGAVITNAATGNSNVKALVFIDAFAPDQDETVLQLVAAQPGSALGGDPTTVFKFVPYPGSPPGDVDLYVLPNVFPHAFANDLPARTGAVLAATQRPLAFSAASEPSGVPAWKSIPSWYLVGTADNVLPPAEQRFMAQRAQAHTIEVDASHLSMISQPDDVTALIVKAVRSTT